jgi:hypothetical protein
LLSTQYKEPPTYNNMIVTVPAMGHITDNLDFASLFPDSFLVINEFFNHIYIA